MCGVEVLNALDGEELCIYVIFFSPPRGVTSVVSKFIFTRHNMATPNIGRAGLSDSSDNEDLFASPSRTSKQTNQSESHPSESSDLLSSRGNGASKYHTEQNRDALLQKELEGVRGINEVIEGVVSSLECAKGNMEVSILVIVRDLCHLYI
jgi:hypothetical protein